MTKQKEPAWQKEPDRQKEIAGIFPDYMREKWRQALSRADKLQEIRLGIGQPVRLRIAGEERFLSSQGEICREPKEAWRMTGRELDE